jgi:hypothetical protein
MRKRFVPMLCAALFLLTAPPIAYPAPEPSACQLFPETGKKVCGPFLTYWKGHGALAQQGYPISNEFRETSDVDGKPYNVQYFERAVFEYHPENPPPYDVLLSLLGSMAFKERYPNGVPDSQKPPTLGILTGPGRYFPQTGKTVSGIFLDYWNNHGGLAQQGYPISDPFMESVTKTTPEYLVQYFERAVFEYHPENPAPYNVLLSRLGAAQFQRKYPNGEPIPTLVQAGTWGGDHISMAVTDGGANIEYDCAHGTIDQPLILDANGHFDATGIHVFEHGGPVYANEEPDAHPARYTGQVIGTTMTLTIVTTDQNRTIGTFTLTFGKEARVFKCL